MMKNTDGSVRFFDAPSVFIEKIKEYYTEQQMAQNIRQCVNRSLQINFLVEFNGKRVEDSKEKIKKQVFEIINEDPAIYYYLKDPIGEGGCSKIFSIKRRASWYNKRNQTIPATDDMWVLKTTKKQNDAK